MSREFKRSRDRDLYGWEIVSWKWVVEIGIAGIDL
jgi:hypothetical protein